MCLLIDKKSAIHFFTSRPHARKKCYGYIINHIFGNVNMKFARENAYFIIFSIACV